MESTAHCKNEVPHTLLLKDNGNVAMLVLLDKLWLADTHQQCSLQSQESEGSNEVATKSGVTGFRESNRSAEMLHDTLVEHSILGMAGGAKDVPALLEKYKC